MQDLARLKCKLVLQVFAKRAASYARIVIRSGDCRQVVASRRIGRVQLIAGEQTVALRADVTQLQQDIVAELALDGQVVLIGILHP